MQSGPKLIKEKKVDEKKIKELEAKAIKMVDELIVPKLEIMLDKINNQLKDDGVAITFDLNWTLYNRGSDES